MQTIKEILHAKGIVCDKPNPSPINLKVGPYLFSQDGSQRELPWPVYGQNIIEMVKYLAPNQPLFETLSKGFDTEAVSIAQRLARRFANIWTAMFDVLKTTPADLKEYGGLVACPNKEYWQQVLLDVENGKISAIDARKECEFVMTECIVHDYMEMERLNKNLPNDKKMKLTERTAGFVLSLVQEREEKE